MKKLTLVLMGVCLGVACNASAAVRSAKGLSQSEQLGVTAGLALACNAGAKLDDFELIASRIMANQALSEADEKQAYKDYAAAKFGAFQEHKKNPQLTCGDVLASFNRLPIFRSVVYADGGVKMHDGTYLKPRRPVLPVPAKK